MDISRKRQKMIEISIEQGKCTRCGRCVKVCPSGLFLAEKGRVPRVERPQNCIECGHCVDVCQGACIRHNSFPESKIHEVKREFLPTPGQLMELIRSRRSNRTITRKPVPQEVIDDILESARYAPTAENTRNVRVTVIRDAEAVGAVEDNVMRFFVRLAGVLMSRPVAPLTRLLAPDLYKEGLELKRFERRWSAGERPCTCNATVLLCFSAPSGYDFAMHDCNLAYQNASLMAEAHGISQVYMGLIGVAMKMKGKRSVRKLLGIPRGHKLCAMMGLGVPAFQYERYTER